jgi:hypothetical protein
MLLMMKLLTEVFALYVFHLLCAGHDLADKSVLKHSKVISDISEFRPVFQFFQHGKTGSHGTIRRPGEGHHSHRMES